MNRFRLLKSFLLQNSTKEDILNKHKFYKDLRIRILNNWKIKNVRKKQKVFNIN